MSFHNPYHFVPAKNGNRVGDLDRKDFPVKQSHTTHAHVTHDRYLADTLSGRLICRITTEDPIFIGDTVIEEQTDTHAKKVKHFELPDGTPAIPASTLRGMITSLAEAASNSALRVLNDDLYSFRRSMTDPKNMSAIGMVFVIKNEANETIEYRLRPLTLPTIPVPQGQPITLPATYRNLFPKPNLKVYINNPPSGTYRDDNKEFFYLKLKKDRQWQNGTQIAWDNCLKIKAAGNTSFLLGQNPTDNSCNPIAHEVWRNKPESERKEYERGILRVMDEPGRDLPETRKHEIFIPYPEACEDESLWPTFKILESAIERFYELADQRTEEEATLPYEPIGTDRNVNANVTKFRLKDGDLVYFLPSGDGATIAEISFSAIWRGRVEFGPELLLRKATTFDFFESIDKELLPFNRDREVLTLAEQLFGFVEQNDKDSYLLKRGDIRDIKGLIIKLRERRDSLSEYFFSKFSNATQRLFNQFNVNGGVDNELKKRLIVGLNDLLRKESLYEEERFKTVSLSNQTKNLIHRTLHGKELLRLNRMLLEDAYSNEIVSNQSSLSLAGRVRISHGRFRGIKNNAGNGWEIENTNYQEGAAFEDEEILKILSSPKPPSPSMYFKRSNGSGAYIAKADLNPTQHHPQGRKFYLHRNTGANRPWRTNLIGEDLQDVIKQVVRITALKPKAVFYFHIDFSNLSEVELALLLYALQPYNPIDQQPLINFRHKIGMGKPIGLGKIKIEPVGLFQVNRIARYSSGGFFKERYAKKWLGVGEDVAQLPDTYKEEKSATMSATIATLDLQAIRSKFTLHPDIHRAIELIGDPTHLQGDVHTPTVEGQEREKETFKWFVANDIGSGNKQQGTWIDSQHAYLKPIKEDSPHLPTLPKHSWNGD
jgi:CRISPR-associated protein (TIGR03986 family)